MVDAHNREILSPALQLLVSWWSIGILLAVLVAIVAIYVYRTSYPKPTSNEKAKFDSNTNNYDQDNEDEYYYDDDELLANNELYRIDQKKLSLPLTEQDTGTFGLVYTFETHASSLVRVQSVKTVPLRVFPVWSAQQRYLLSVDSVAVHDDTVFSQWIASNGFGNAKRSRQWSRAHQIDVQDRKKTRGSFEDNTHMITQAYKYTRGNVLEFTSRMDTGRASSVADFFTTTFVVDASAGQQLGWNIQIERQLGFSCQFVRTNQSQNTKARPYDMLALTVLTGCQLGNAPVTFVVYNMIANTPLIALRNALKLFRVTDSNGDNNPFVNQRVVMFVNCLSMTRENENFENKLIRTRTGTHKCVYAANSLQVNELRNHTPAVLRNIFSASGTTTVYKTSFTFFSDVYERSLNIATVGNTIPTVTNCSVVSLNITSKQPLRYKRDISPSLDHDHVRHLAPWQRNEGYTSKLIESTGSEFSTSDDNDEDDASREMLIDVDDVSVDEPIGIGMPHFSAEDEVYINDDDDDDDDDEEIYNATDKEVLIASTKPSAPDEQDGDDTK